MYIFLLNEKQINLNGLNCTIRNFTI